MTDICECSQRSPDWRTYSVLLILFPVWKCFRWRKSSSTWGTSSFWYMISWPMREQHNLKNLTFGQSNFKTACLSMSLLSCSFGLRSGFGPFYFVFIGQQRQREGMTRCRGHRLKPNQRHCGGCAACLLNHLATNSFHLILFIFLIPWEQFSTSVSYKWSLVDLFIKAKRSVSHKRNRGLLLKDVRCLK